MSGVKQFDTEETLAAIVEVFWRKGFEATSLRDLEEATGLSRSSLYNAFGDKQAMFLRALDVYTTRLVEAATPPKEEDACKAIVAMMERRAARLEDAAHPPGCLVTNALAERGGAGDSVARALTAVVSVCEERIYETIRRGQRAGMISRDEDPRALARFFTGVSQAMAIMSKASGDPSVARDILRVSMSVLSRGA